jgi:hypothetical protein
LRLRPLGRKLGASSRVFLFAFLFLLCGLAWPAAKASILRTEFLRTEPAFAGQQFGNTGAYHAAVNLVTCPPGVPADGTRPVPASLARAVIAAFGVRMRQAEVTRTGVVRCAKGVVFACLTGANLNCGKADARRSSIGGTAWCKDHADADFIPQAATGNATVYYWRCEGDLAVPERQVQAIDAWGYAAGNWRALKASILRTEFLRTEPAFAGQQFGNTGAYHAAVNLVTCPPGVPADGTRPVPASLPRRDRCIRGTHDASRGDADRGGSLREGRGFRLPDGRRPQLRQGRYQKKLYRRDGVVQGPCRCRLRSASCHGKCHGLILALRRRSRCARTAGPGGRCVGLRSRELARPQAVMRSLIGQSGAGGCAMVSEV